MTTSAQGSLPAATTRTAAGRGDAARTVPQQGPRAEAPLPLPVRVEAPPARAARAEAPPPLPVRVEAPLARAARVGAPPPLPVRVEAPLARAARVGARQVAGPGRVRRDRRALAPTRAAATSIRLHRALAAVLGAEAEAGRKAVLPTAVRASAQAARGNRGNRRPGPQPSKRLLHRRRQPWHR